NQRPHWKNDACSTLFRNRIGPSVYRDRQPSDEFGASRRHSIDWFVRRYKSSIPAFRSSLANWCSRGPERSSMRVRPSRNNATCHFQQVRRGVHEGDHCRRGDCRHSKGTHRERTSAVSEVDKYRHLLERHPRLFIGNGIDIGSGGDPVVPWAIQIDLPEVLFQIYNQRSPGYSIQFRSVTAATDLPFKDSVLDFVFSSHLLEDFLDWKPVLAEWIRVLKPDGYLII